MCKSVREHDVFTIDCCLSGSPIVFISSAANIIFYEKGLTAVMVESTLFSTIILCLHGSFKKCRYKSLCPFSMLTQSFLHKFLHNYSFIEMKLLIKIILHNYVFQNARYNRIVLLITVKHRENILSFMIDYHMFVFVHMFVRAPYSF